MINMGEKYDLIVIGGGLVGLASAYKIQKKMPQVKILILEKEQELALHQSGRNSGVLHSGLYYKQGSYRAKNCVSGRRELVDFAKNHHIEHEVCGKLVVATNERESMALPGLLKKGRDNGLENLEIVNAKKIKEIEPYVRGISAIWVPETGIIDYRSVANKLASLIKEINPQSNVFTNSEVLKISHSSTYSTIYTNDYNFRCDQIISCGGLFSDRLAIEDGLKLDFKIVGFRGDYFTLKDHAKHKVNNIVYPVPNPEFPFLGVHFTRMINGEIECGPNAVFTFKREGYNKMSFSFKDTFDSLGYIGTWKLFFNHWKFGLNEMVKASSKRIFLKHLQQLIPSLKMSDISAGRSGVRAMALGKDGEIIEDFQIINTKKSIHVLNAPSPAATACLSIGERVALEFQKKYH
tara:strand:- start:1143 stop:2363 length:1221 start_codon:yes stop_codon:yes gene_type:complete